MDEQEHGFREGGERAREVYETLKPATPERPIANITAREKLYRYLLERPAGADSRELASLLLRGIGSDPELGARFIRGLLGSDINFSYDALTGLWSLRETEALKVPLDEAELVVVDLETVGGRPGPDSIIEIGAYRMRGRQILHSFQSLIRPGTMVPRFITRLTGISNEMLAEAPSISHVLPAFREFLGQAVMVAHNAPFDRSFLDFEFRRLFGIGLQNPVLCTIRLARRLLPSVKRRRLDLLAEHFGLSTVGRHRALGDARMTAELLSIMIEMLDQMGIKRLDRLIDYHGRSPAGHRLERHVPPEMIAAMPRLPGVYLMRDERGELLYIGKAIRLRERVASYFSTSNINAKTSELINHVWEIETRVMRSPLEAALMEALLIREHKPPYNKMLKAAAPAFVIQLDFDDPFPRLKVARKLTTKASVVQLGPFIGRRNLERSVEALSRLLGLRVCTGRLSPHEDFSPCIYGQMHHCSSPCNLSISENAYNLQFRRAVSFLRGRSGPILGELARARDQAGAAMRFEEARRRHRELDALATLTERTTRRSRILAENNLVIVLRAEDADAPPTSPVAYVVLSGRLALVQELDATHAAHEIATFVASNYERYRSRAVTRDELEPMMIVARWLKEREPEDGRLIYLDGPSVDPLKICRAAGVQAGAEVAASTSA
jgi:DNA polymerase-3 subunit epsilon